MLLKLSEIFYSIQGEGVHIGRPSVFLRTALCNLKCKWCDTPYTWDWGKYDMRKEVFKAEIDEVVSIIKNLPPSPLVEPACRQAGRSWGEGKNCKNIVLTGGEPMLQQKGLAALMEQLKPEGYFFEVETNGTMAIEPKFDALIDQYNCSPKLKNSGNAASACETKYFKMYAQNPKTWFKFVVEDKKDLAEVEIFVSKYNLQKSRILLMPQAKTKLELKKKGKSVLKMALQKNWKFTPRKHIELWGNQRGV